VRLPSPKLWNIKKKAEGEHKSEGIGGRGKGATTRWRQHSKEGKKREKRKESETEGGRDA